MTDGSTALRRLLAAPVTIIVGHYGVGKTSFALNLALASAAEGFQTALADLDVVNPYFRAAEYRDELEAAGVEVIAPVFSERGSNLDVPSLNGAIVPAIEEAQAHAGDRRLIIDAGGDDAGATALGRFAPLIAAGDYAMICVVNSRRLQTAGADEALEILREIEVKARLSATGVVSNAHLKAATDEDVVKQGVDVAAEVARLAGLDFLAYTLAPGMETPLGGIDAPAFFMRRAVRAPWE
ncbi:MAG: ParA family protein [Eggerthellaceae bacterium]|nr:ParA family protein [Eggerthellaceae bacterium]